MSRAASAFMLAGDSAAAYARGAMSAEMMAMAVNFILKDLDSKSAERRKSE